MPVLAQFNQDNFEATDQIRCLKIYVPDGDGYLPLVAGLLSLMGDPANYQDPDSAQAQGVAAVCRDAYIETSWEGCGTPPECDPVTTEINIWSNAVSAISGQPVVFTFDPAIVYSIRSQQAAPLAVTDKTAIFRTMAAGNWFFRFTYMRNTNNAIIVVKFDDLNGTVTQTLPMDLYGTLLRNQVITGLFPVDVAGYTRISFEVTGKNAASSDYAVPWTLFQAWKI